MERNIVRRLYDKFFVEKPRPDLKQPNRCVKLSEVEEFLRMSEEFLERKDASRLRSLVVKLKSNVWARMKERDEELAIGKFGEVEEDVMLETDWAKKRRYYRAYGGRRGMSRLSNTELPFGRVEEERKEPFGDITIDMLIGLETTSFEQDMQAAIALNNSMPYIDFDTPS